MEKIIHVEPWGSTAARIALPNELSSEFFSLPSGHPNKAMRKRQGYKQVATNDEGMDSMSADQLAEANGMVYSNGIWLKPGLEEAVKNKKTDYTAVRKDLLKATLQREIEECKARERAEKEKNCSEIKCGLIFAALVILFIFGVFYSLPHDFHHHYAKTTAAYNKHKEEIFKHLGTAYNHYKKSRGM